MHAQKPSALFEIRWTNKTDGQGYVKKMEFHWFN